MFKQGFVATATLYVYVRLLSLTFQLFKRNPKTKQLVCTNLVVNRSVQKLQFNTVCYLFLVELYCVIKLSIFFALDSFIFILKGSKMANVYMDRISNHSEDDNEYEERKCCTRDCVTKQMMRKNLLIIFGIAAGVLLGVLLRTYDEEFSENERNQMYIGSLGTL